VCWICDHPGATERDYQEHMRLLINTYGWAVQGVERDGIHPPWAYTVGLTRAGHRSRRPIDQPPDAMVRLGAAASQASPGFPHDFLPGADFTLGGMSGRVDLPPGRSRHG